MYRNMGIEIDAEKLFTPYFTDDQVMLAEYEDGIHYMPRILDEQ